MGQIELNWLELDWIGFEGDGLDELMIKMGNLEIEEDLKEIKEFDKNGNRSVFTSILHNR